MPDREKVIKGLGNVANAIVDGYICEPDQAVNTIADAIALLKEQEEQVKQWTKEIAENQIAHAPNDYPMSLDEQLENEYKRGIWDGLQIAWNIISEGR